MLNKHWLDWVVENDCNSNPSQALSERQVYYLVNWNKLLLKKTELIRQFRTTEEFYAEAKRRSNNAAVFISPKEREPKEDNDKAETVSDTILPAPRVRSQTNFFVHEQELPRSLRKDISSSVLPPPPPMTEETDSSPSNTDQTPEPPSPPAVSIPAVSCTDPLARLKRTARIDRLMSGGTRQPAPDAWIAQKALWYNLHCCPDEGVELTHNAYLNTQEAENFQRRAIAEQLLSHGRAPR